MLQNHNMPEMLDSSTELRLIKLLATLAEYKASDLHLTVANPPAVRIGDRIQPLTGEALLTNDFIVNIVQALLTPTQLQQLELRKDIVLTVALKGKTRYRMHVYSQQGNISITFRLIPETIQPLSRWPVHQAIQQCLTIQRGLIIITGAYGSGKSSLLSAFIEEYNQNSPVHIMTFEQPIEYVFTDAKAIIEQVELGTDLPDLQTALPRVYQEDLNIIAVNSLLDAAAIRTIMQFVHMGKLVLVELMAPNVQGALESILNCFHATEQPSLREDLSSVLEAVIALQPHVSGGQTSLACEVLRRNTATINFIKHEGFDKIPLLLENGRSDGMITFEQSLN